MNLFGGGNRIAWIYRGYDACHLVFICRCFIAHVRRLCARGHIDRTYGRVCVQPG